MFYRTIYVRRGRGGAQRLAYRTRQACLSVSSRHSHSASCATRSSASPCGCATARARPRTDPDVVPPISAFVAAGFEHSIANAYFVPSPCSSRRAPPAFWTAIDRASTDFVELTWSHFLIDNLLPVTIGNIVGGSVFVAIIYWFVYLRGSRA